MWNAATDLAVQVHRLTARFPDAELNGLTGQLRRSAVSVAASIAEGHARAASGQLAYYLSQASTSLAELETQLAIAERLGYAEEEIPPVLGAVSEVGRMLAGFRKSITCWMLAASR